jgi:hypothetical protein
MRVDAIRLAVLPCNVAASVIVNGVTVFHEDDDKGYHQEFTAERVAEQLAKAFNTQYSKITLSWDDIEGGEEEWNFDDVENAVNADKGILDHVLCNIKCEGP